MAAEIVGLHPVLASNDVAASIRFYRSLGFVLTFQDQEHDPKYVALRRENVELHVQWADREQYAYPTDRPVYRFLVGDVDTAYEDFAHGLGSALSESARGQWATPADTPWGTREFHLRDPGQNILQFYRAR